MLKRMRQKVARVNASPKPADERRVLMPTCLLQREQGTPTVAAVGESHYQAPLVAICGRRDGEAVCYECEALLVVEFDNQFDENAVHVEINGHIVAYLSREDAIAYRPLLLDLHKAGFMGTCRALIVGRDRRDPETQTINLGVCLDLADADACRAALQR
jgi:hypothetical protein